MSFDAHFVLVIEVKHCTSCVSLTTRKGTDHTMPVGRIMLDTAVTPRLDLRLLDCLNLSDSASSTRGRSVFLSF